MLLILLPLVLLLPALSVGVVDVVMLLVVVFALLLPLFILLLLLLLTLLLCVKSNGLAVGTTEGT